MLYCIRPGGGLRLNRKIGLLIILLLALVAVAVIAGSCLRGLAGEPVAIWTPAPATSGSPGATLRGAILPTLPAQPTRTPTRPRATATPTADTTADPKLIIITEADVVNAVAAGIGVQQGLTIEDLGVAFTDGKMRLTAGRLSYGPADVLGLVLVGSLVAQDGRLQLQTESISPGGLITSLVPSFANQALAQYAAQWYVEEVRTLDGRLELRIR
jgi:hypothetical protein